MFQSVSHGQYDTVIPSRCDRTPLGGNHRSVPITCDVFRVRRVSKRMGRLRNVGDTTDPVKYMATAIPRRSGNRLSLCAPPNTLRKISCCGDGYPSGYGLTSMLMKILRSTSQGIARARRVVLFVNWA